MRVLLINPPRFDGVSVVREERCENPERYTVIEPYSLLQVGALLRQHDHEVSLIDLNGFNLEYDQLIKKVKEFKPDLGIFRFTPTTFDHDLRTASIVKENAPGASTAGICWTLRTMPKQVLREAPALDYYVRRDYEVVAPALVDALEAGDASQVDGLAFRRDGQIIINKDPKEIVDYDDLPLPAFDLLPSLDPYYITAPAGRPFSIIYTSKGCPFKCSFCTVAGTAWKPKSATKVVEELRFLKKNYRLRTASFFDETFTLDKKRVVSICQALMAEDINIRWYCNTRTHLVDKELLLLMRKAGCRGISLGVESGSQRILDKAEKCTSIAQAKNAICWAKQARIKTLCSFIIGLPGENWSTVRETIAFVNETLPNGAQFNVAVPYPGTRLFESIYGPVTDDIDFRLMHQDDAMVGTEEMSPQELNQAREEAYRSLYTNPRWWSQNVGHVIVNPEDAEIALRYGIKVVKNFFVYHMVHAH